MWRYGRKAGVELVTDWSYICTMSKREAKKLKILLAGLAVMRIKGYNGTSVKDIVSAAEVPKGSFYNYFDSKEDFVIAAIDYTANQMLGECVSILDNTVIPPLERLQRFFSMAIETACLDEFRSGCFLGNMCQEMSDNSEAIRAKLYEVLSLQTGLIKRVLEEGRAQRCFEAQMQPDVMAEFLFSAWQGSLMSMKTARSRAPLDVFLETLPYVLKR